MYIEFLYVGVIESSCHSDVDVWLWNVGFEKENSTKYGIERSEVT